MGAYKRTKEGAFYQGNPAAKAAVEQVIERKQQDLPNGIRLSNYGTAREKIIDGIEAALNNNRSTQEALNIAAQEAQAIIDKK